MNILGLISQLIGIKTLRQTARSKRKLQLKQWKENWHDSYEDSKIYRQRMLFHDSKFHLLPKKHPEG